MKKIETLIHSQSWDSLREQLSALGIRGTLREVKTFGYAPPVRGVYRGTSYLMDVASGLELALVVSDELVEQAVAVLETSSTGEILVTPVERIEASAERHPAPAVLQATQSERPAALRSRVFSYT